MTQPASAIGIQRISETLIQFESLPPSSKKLYSTLLALFEQCNNPENLSPSIAKKFSYTAEGAIRTIKLTRAEYMARGVDIRMSTIYGLCVNISSSLMQEAIIYNLFHCFMDKRYNLILNKTYIPSYRALGGVPDFGITATGEPEESTTASEEPDKLVIENTIGSLISFLKIPMADLSEEECKALFAMTDGFYYTPKTGVEILNLNSFNLIADNLNSPSKNIQTFAAFLASFYVNLKIVQDEPSLFLIFSIAIKTLKSLKNGGIEPLYPLLNLVYSTAKQCQSSKTNLGIEVLSPSFVFRFKMITENDWIYENAALYGILQRIKKKCETCIGIIQKDALTLKNAMRKGMAVTPVILVVSSLVNDLFSSGQSSGFISLRATTSKKRYPISPDKPFVEDEKAFQKFCADLSLFHELDSAIRTRNDFSNQAVKMIYFPKIHFPDPLTFDARLRLNPKLSPTEILEFTPPGGGGASGGASGGAGAGGGAQAGAGAGSASSRELEREGISPILAREVEELPSLTAEETDLEAFPEVLETATAKELPFTFTIARRVRAWQKSAELGLACYRYDERIPGSLPRDEMILRHRLPPQLFKLAFRPEYSLESVWTNKSLAECRHFKSLLYIEDKPYILEATVDQDGVLYHFYAKKITSAIDLTSSGITELEEPPAPEIEEEPFLEFVCSKEVVYSAEGDALITFEGHTYKLLKK